MVGTDLVMIPAAFYSAMSLRLGSLEHLDVTGIWPYFAVLLTALPVFVRLGLYRAVVRYIGGRAILAVLAGVTLWGITVVTFSLTNAGGATSIFVGGVNSCDTVGATGSCTVAISSSVGGRNIASMTASTAASCSASDGVVLKIVSGASRLRP